MNISRKQLEFECRSTNWCVGFLIMAMEWTAEIIMAVLT